MAPRPTPGHPLVWDARVLEALFGGDATLIRSVVPVVSGLINDETVQSQC